MAHNLNIIDNRASFASTKKAWHGLGQILTERMTAQEALEHASLNYNVAKVPTLTESFITEDAEVIPPLETGHFSTIRTDTQQVLGNVGSQYTVIQNRDAFKFFDPIISRDEAIYETAGALGKGEIVFLTAKLPAHIRVGKDDLVEMYVVFWNSHDGSSACYGLITPVRVVCNNTLNAAIRVSKGKVSIRHSASAEQRLKEAHKILGLSNKLQEELSDIFAVMNTSKISDKDAGKTITKFFATDDEFKRLLTGESGGEVFSTRKQNIIREAWEFYNQGIGQEEILGTGWGVYNGLTGYLSHKKKYSSPKNKMKGLLVDNTTAKAMNLVMSAIA